MNIKNIVVGKSSQIYCPGFQDGRIMKILLKKTGQVIYACEECDATWLSLEDIFDDEKGEDLIDYLETLGYIKEGIEVAWDDFRKNQGFVTLQDVEHIIKKYNIKIIPPTPL